MYVGWHMKRELIVISPDTPMMKARELMDNHHISHLPVTDGRGRLVGLVTDRNLKESWASPASSLSVYELTYLLQKLTVKDVMTKKVITATPDTTIERAALIIHDNRIGALPVVHLEKLVGIITRADLMEVLLTALGMSEDSARVSVIVRDRIGVLAEVGQVMQRAGINIRSIVNFPLKEYKDIWQLVLRVNVTVHAQAIKALEDAGFKLLPGYAEDLTPHLPE